MRILVVEDEPKVARALAQGLGGEGFEVVVARTGEEGCVRVLEGAPDAVVLDLGLPGRDGLQILRTLRGRGVRTPVLILTARDAVEDRVTGLEAGADDYLVKPFAFPELVARIRALLRRGRASDVVRLACGDCELDLLTRTARRGGRALDLTAREQALLELLLRHAGEVVSRDTLAREVLGEPARSATVDNLLDAHLARLRRKLEAGGAPRLVHTLRGVGFVAREGAP